MKKIYITGISGTGKTTIAKTLEDLGFYAISTDEVPNLCVWINKQTKEKVNGDYELNKDFIDAHDWVCDVEYLKKLMDKDVDVIFVLGVSKNQKDYFNLFDKVLLLQCKPETFIERIKMRSDNDFGKDETAQQSILSWYQRFEEETLNDGAISINAEQPVKEVVSDILKEIL